MSTKSYEDPDVSVGRDQGGQEELEDEGEDSKHFPAGAGPDLSAALHSVIHRPLRRKYSVRICEIFY